MKGDISVLQGGTVYVIEENGDRHIVGASNALDEGEFKGGYFIPNDGHKCPECYPTQ